MGVWEVPSPSTILAMVSLSGPRRMG
jgi:hypothetical protein